MAYEANTIVEARVKYVVNSQVCFNVLHYKPDSTGTGFLVQDMVTGLVNVLSANAAGGWAFEQKKLMGDNVEIQEIACQVVFPTRYRAVKIPLAVNGTAGSDCTAQNLQGTIVKYGELANRHNIGSMHIGGLASADQNYGLVANAWLVKADQFINDFLEVEQTDGISTVAYRPVILNRTKVVIDGVDTYPITGSVYVEDWVPKNEIRTQRTRTVGRGI